MGVYDHDFDEAGNRGIAIVELTPNNKEDPTGPRNGKNQESTAEKGATAVPPALNSCTTIVRIIAAVATIRGLLETTPKYASPMICYDMMTV